MDKQTKKHLKYLNERFDAHSDILEDLERKLSELKRIFVNKMMKQDLELERVNDFADDLEDRILELEYKLDSLNGDMHDISDELPKSTTNFVINNDKSLGIDVSTEKKAKWYCFAGNEHKLFDALKDEKVINGRINAKYDLKLGAWFKTDEPIDVKIFIEWINGEKWFKIPAQFSHYVCELYPDNFKQILTKCKTYELDFEVEN